MGKESGTDPAKELVGGTGAGSKILELYRCWIMRQRLKRPLTIVMVMGAMLVSGVTMLVFGYGNISHNELAHTSEIKEVIFLSGISVLLIWALLVYAALFRREKPEGLPETKW